MRILMKGSVAFIIAALIASGTGRARADDALKEDLKKLVEGGSKSTAEEIAKTLNARAQGFIDEVVKIVDARTAERFSKLENDLKARDKRIGELEAQLKALTQKAAPTPAAAPAAGASSTFLGVGHLDVPAEQKAKLKIEGGALVTQVLEDSPAATAGIQANDVIVDIQGTPVNSANLGQIVAGLKADQEINITYLRDGNRITKAAKLADREKYFAARAAKSQPAPAKKEPVVLGVTVQEKEGGLLVESTEEGFTGAVAGLKAGDRLTHLNGKELKSLEDVQGEIKKLVEGDKLVLIYKRGEEVITVSVLGAHGKEGSKLLATESQKPKPKEEAKPAEKKPGFLGVAVVQDMGGVLIESVVDATAAAAAGIKKGDILKKVNGQEVKDVDSLKGALEKLSAGDKVAIELAREGKAVELKDVELKAQGEKVAAAAAPAKPEPPAPPKAKQKGILGIVATQTLENQIIVRTVSAGGAAEKAELKVGDVILKVNDKAVANFDELAKILQPLFAGDKVTLRVRRGSDEKDIQVTLGEA
jgi:serine protease Do